MNVRYEIQSRLRASPFVLERLWKFRRFAAASSPLDRRRVVQRGDDLVIEGYPRSANTFALDAFLLAQGRELLIGNHMHSPAQFLLARKYGVPAMLVLRKPLDAALSYVVFAEGSIGAADALRSYLRFHRPLLAIQDSFVPAPFEEVTGDFDICIERLNQRFGTSFASVDHTEDFERRVFDVMKERQMARQRLADRDFSHRFSSPNAAKQVRREEIGAQFEDPRLARLKTAAEACYETLIAGVR